MNKISFYLKRPTSDSPQTVFLYSRLNGRQLKLYTNIKVHPKNWMMKRQRVKSSVNNAVLFNDHLDRITTQVTKIILDIENKNIPATPERVKDKLKSLRSPNTAKTVFEYWEDWLSASEEIKAAGTIKGYRSILHHIKNFSEDRGFTVTFESMDRHFINSLTDYLLKIKLMTNASLWNAIKTWKAFMKWARLEGLTDNRFDETITKKDFNVPEHRLLRLTAKELQSIVHTELPEGGAHDNARNLFVLQCCLGVRYGDLERIVSNPENYVDGEFIRLSTQKNKKPVAIPLLPMARKILTKTNRGLYPISNQKFNNYIKVVAEGAGLTDKIVRTEYRGTRQVRKAVRKCDEIASHTAKRTFVSLMITQGLSVEAIMKITGNSRATIDRYVILNEEDVRKEMQKAADLLK